MKDREGLVYPKESRELFNVGTEWSNVMYRRVARLFTGIYTEQDRRGTGQPFIVIAPARSTDGVSGQAAEPGAGR